MQSSLDAGPFGLSDFPDASAQVAAACLADRCTNPTVSVGATTHSPPMYFLHLDLSIKAKRHIKSDVY